MNPRPTLLGALLGASLCISNAQAQSALTSPAGLLSTEGDQYSWMLGEYSDGRMMFFDGEMRGRVAVIKEVAHRHDYRSHHAGTTMGRSWTNVTLDLAPCDYAKANLSFTLNPTATPTRVFSSSVTWPSVNGFPATQPATWDIKFPFSQSFIFTGQSDICLDYDFTGGKLANGRSWSTSWYQSYYLDGFNGGDRSQGSYVQLGTGCQDSGQTRPAYCYIYSDLHSNTYSNVSYRDKYRVQTRTRYTVPGKNVFHALSPDGSSKGFTFPGVNCEGLFIDPSKPFFVVPVAAGTNTNAEAWLDWGLLPYQKSLEGLKIYVQAAWEDSKTKGVKLTYGEIGTMPKYPRPFKRAMIYQYDTSQKAISSTGTLYTDFRRNPVIRYGQ